MEPKHESTPVEQPRPAESPPLPKRRFRLVKLSERLRIEKLEERIVPSASGGGRSLHSGGFY
jgi:hypothetical protein